MRHTVRNRFRQTATVAVALLLVLSVFGPVGTVAAQEAMITQSDDAVTAAPGETVTLTSTVSVDGLNGQGFEAMLPAEWQGTITDADGGAAKPPDGSANVLQVVWLQSGTYEVTYEIEVPDDAAPGDYTLDAESSGINPEDDSRVVESAQTTITVAEPDDNEPPTASFTSSPDSPETGEQVSFDASGSSDDSAITSYEWDFGDGTTATGVSASHTYDSAGDYTVTLTVTDDDGDTDTDTQTVSVSEEPPENQPPTADAGDDQTVDEGDSVTLDASESSDADGSIASYAWTQTAGPSVTLSDETAAQPTFTAPDVDGDQTLTFQVTVTDDDGETATDSVSVTVQNVEEPPENQPPTAAFTAPSSADVDESVSFDASASSDSDGSIASYEWDFDGDGTTDATGEQASTSFDSAGDYDVTLTVTDDEGATDSTTQTVSVSEAPGEDDPAATTVSLSPESDLVAVDQSTAFDVVVDDADGGVGAYALTITVEDADVASITDVELAGVSDEQLTDVQIAADGSSATVEAVGIDTADTGSVTIATVTVQADAEGASDVSLDVADLGTEAGEPYDVTGTTGASLEASTLVVGDSENPAQDLDGDGVYEDVNGDGVVDLLDVQTLFADRDGAAVSNSPEAFDYNGDGEFTVLDIQALFAQVTG